MGMLGNFARIYIGRTAEGSAHALLPGQHNDYSHHEGFIGRDGEVTTDKRLARPSGFYLPDVYDPPINVGDISLNAPGEGSLTAYLYASRSMSVDMTGSGDLEATAALVIAMAAALTGTGSLTATINGQLNASIDFTGQGDLAADIEALGNMVIDLTGEGDLAATIAAFGNMDVDMVVTGTGLNTANVGGAVWNTLLEAGFTADLLLRIIAAATAGKVSGAPGSPVFRNVGDTKNQITGVADSSGNRTSATYGT